MWRSSALLSCLLSPSTQCPTVLCLSPGLTPLQSQRHCLPFSLLLPYLPYLSSNFSLSSFFPFVQKTLPYFQVPLLHKVSPAIHPSPSHFWDVFLTIMTSALHHWAHLCFAPSGIYLQISNKPLVFRHSQTEREEDYKGHRHFTSSFILERKRYEKTTVTTCVIILFCQLLSQKMLYLKGSQPAQRKTVEYGNLFIHLVSHPCSFEFQIMKPIALVLFPE